MKKKRVISVAMTLLFFVTFAGLMVPLTRASTTAGWITTVIAHTPIGNGQVNNWNNIIGEYGDTKMAQIYGGNEGDGGLIVGQMSSTVPAGDEIQVLADYAPNYLLGAVVWVEISNSASGPWTNVGSAKITAESPTEQWIVYLSLPNGQQIPSFSYIEIAGYDYGWSVNIYVDCVNAVGP